MKMVTKEETNNTASTCSTCGQGSLETTTQTTTTAEQPKNKKTWLWILLGCGGCIVCTVVIVVVLLAVGSLGFVSVYNTFREELAKANTLCKVDTDSDLRAFYEDQTTEEFQRRVPYFEFKRMWERNKDVFTKCDIFAPSIKDLFEVSNYQLTTQDEKTVIKIQRKVGNKTVIAEVVIDKNGSVKFNNLEVTTE